MNGELRLLVDLVEPDGLVELDLAGDRAGIALLIHPLHGERVVLVEAAYLAHLVDQLLVPNPVVDVSDEHAPAMRSSDDKGSRAENEACLLALSRSMENH